MSKRATSIEGETNPFSIAGESNPRDLAGKTNPVIIAGKTAVHYWLHSDSPAFGNQAQPLPSQTASMVLATASASFFATDLSESLFGKPPYEILVQSTAARHNKPNIRYLIAPRELPSGSLIQLASGLLVCSPALSFCQTSRTLPLAQSIELGTNLCATYWLDWLDTIQTRTRGRPLVTHEALSRFIEANSSFYGIKHARRAIQWVTNGSASPMETKLMILLTLPLRLGGFGFSGAQFNYQVNPGNARARLEQSHFKIDIAFPRAKVGIEFDGADYHLDFSKDRRRINALESLGWRIVSVDKQQLFSPTKMEKTADQIAKLLGIRIQRRDDWRWRNAILRKDLSI